MDWVPRSESLGIFGQSFSGAQLSYASVCVCVCVCVVGPGLCLMWSDSSPRPESAGASD